MKRRSIAALIVFALIVVFALAWAPLFGGSGTEFLGYIIVPLSCALLPAVLLPRKKSMVWSIMIAVIASGFATYTMAQPCSGEGCMANFISVGMFAIPIAATSLLLAILRFFIGRPVVREPAAVAPTET